MQWNHQIEKRFGFFSRLNFWLFAQNKALLPLGHMP
jgi:hypothetical protein